MRLLLPALLLFAGDLCAQGRTGALAAKYGWLTKVEQAKAEARKTGKPIFLVFRCEP